MPMRIDGSSSTTKTDLRVRTVSLCPEGLMVHLFAYPFWQIVTGSSYCPYVHIVLTCKVRSETEHSYCTLITCLNRGSDPACQTVPRSKPVQRANQPASSPSPDDDEPLRCARLFLVHRRSTC